MPDAKKRVALKAVARLRTAPIPGKRTNALAKAKDVKTPPSLKQRRRFQTELEVIEAFGRILVRDGASGIGINAISREAGVSKPLIYDYFGGMPGLFLAWNKKYQLPAPAEGIRHKLQQGSPAERAAAIAEVVVAFGSNLRSRPDHLAIHSDELSSRPALAPYRDSVLAKLDCSADRLFGGDTGPRQEFSQRAVSVLFAAVMYLSLRTRNWPDFLDLELQSEEGWKTTMNTVSEIVQLVLNAKRS